MELSPYKNSNLLGVAASGLCAVHCAVAPLIFAAKPLLEHATDEHGYGGPLWAAFDYVFLVLSLVAVWYSTCQTNHSGLKRILWTSWLVLATGLLFEAVGMPHGHWLMYGGSVALIVAHLKNHRYCRVGRVAVE